VTRATLPNGDWCDLVDRLTYAQARRLNEARGTPDAAGVVVAALVTNWALRGIDDEPIPFPELAADGIPLDALNGIPYDVFLEIATAAMALLPGQPDPKGMGEQSPDSPPASVSGSITTLPTPIS